MSVTVTVALDRSVQSWGPKFFIVTFVSNLPINDELEVIIEPFIFLLIYIPVNG
jgi:hypothetical protein